MSEELDEEGKKKQKKDLGVVRHVHELLKDKNTDDEDLSKEELEAKLAERDTQLGDIAMKEFEKESKLVTSQVKKQFKRDVKITTTAQLEAYKSLLKDEDDSGSISLADTGGKIPLYEPNKGGFKEASDVINAVYNRIEELRFKRDFKGGLKPEELKALQKLELQRNKLWRKAVEGERKRGKSTRFEAWKCAICGSFVGGSHMCQKCGYIYGSKVDQKKKEEYALGAQ